MQVEKSSAGEMGACPMHAVTYGQQKTGREPLPATVVLERDAQGVWQVRGFVAAREILRGSATKQAGFQAEMVARVPNARNTPILYMEGKPHNEQRRQSARFFTPKAVSEHYRAMMEQLADALVAQLRRRGRADLSRLSMRLAVRVAAEVVGLTNSRLPGMDRRLDAFFQQIPSFGRMSPRVMLRMVQANYRVGAFFALDVRPAIRARKRQLREDVISHLVGLGYNDTEILTECMTYAAAGMVTTREFICMATWHMLEQPALRARYLAAGEEERYQILHELLRLEPIVGHVKRRATEDIALDTPQGPMTIPAGDLIDLHIQAINADAAAVGEDPLALWPDRVYLAERVPAGVMGFGDGAHRCPGAYIAIQETDIFLQRLLALDGLRIVRGPAVSWNDLVTGYELRDFILAAR